MNIQETEESEKACKDDGDSVQKLLDHVTVQATQNVGMRPTTEQPELISQSKLDAPIDVTHMDQKSGVSPNRRSEK